MSDPPKFIALDGPDGAGKSSVAHALVTRLSARGFNVHCYPNPGGTPFGATVRQMVKNAEYPLEHLSVFYLFLAGHVDLAHAIKKRLHAGTTVIVDRWWYSTYCYQGLCGVPDDLIVDNLQHLNQIIVPHEAIYLRATNETAKERMLARFAEFAKDRFEEKGLDFRTKLLTAYDGLADKGYISRIDTDALTIQQVTDQILLRTYGETFQPH